MNDIQVINTWLTKPEDSWTELKNVVNQKLKEKWLWDINTFLTELLIDVAINAESPDVKGNLHKDYWEINKAINTLHKIANPKIGQTNVNVWFFTPPNNINY
jgi:hypothetical protein